jgi:CheY-like chemotaxis protein
MGREAKTVLFIDDDANALSGWSLYLRGTGYQVVSAASVQEGLEFFATKPVDAVVLDYRMPEMDGDEAAGHMKRIKPDVVILMFSGDMSASRNDHASVDHFLIKGLHPSVLVRSLDALLGISETGDSAAAD